MTDAAGISPDIDALKAKMKATWTAGDFGMIAKMLETGAGDFSVRLDLIPGEKVLDVACGTGNLSIPVARTGAVVTGVDIAPNLIEQARTRAAAESLECRFDEGDAEMLQYANASFDTVVTMFGAMFAPRPDRVASELVRVCRPGGRIAMANWTPDAFTGKMFKTSTAYVPPPPNIPSPLLWGDEETVRSRLKDGIAEIRLTHRPILFHNPLSPTDVVEYFRLFFGPTQFAFAALDPAGQDALRDDLVDLWTEHNRATDGSTEVESEYLEVVAIRD